ncbi:hypothetical protein D9M68_897560 [compost metagenome]
MSKCTGSCLDRGFVFCRHNKIAAIQRPAMISFEKFMIEISCGQNVVDAATHRRNAPRIKAALPVQLHPLINQHIARSTIVSDQHTAFVHIGQIRNSTYIDEDDRSFETKRKVGCKRCMISGNQWRTFAAMAHIFSTHIIDNRNACLGSQ